MSSHSSLPQALPELVGRAKGFGVLKSAPLSADDTISSITHYVYLKKDENSVTMLPFSSFLTIFASVMYIKPTQVYIHTDYNEIEIRNASTRGDL